MSISGRWLVNSRSSPFSVLSSMKCIQLIGSTSASSSAAPCGSDAIYSVASASSCGLILCITIVETLLSDGTQLRLAHSGPTHLINDHTPLLFRNSTKPIPKHQTSIINSNVSCSRGLSRLTFSLRSQNALLVFHDELHHGHQLSSVAGLEELSS